VAVLSGAKWRRRIQNSSSLGIWLIVSFIILQILWKSVHNCLSSSSNRRNELQAVNWLKLVSSLLCGGKNVAKYSAPNAVLLSDSACNHTSKRPEVVFLSEWLCVFYLIGPQAVWSVVICCCCIKMFVDFAHLGSSVLCYAGLLQAPILASAW